MLITKLFLLQNEVYICNYKSRKKTRTLKRTGSIFDIFNNY